MTEEQAKLILAICSCLDIGAVTGEGFHKSCHWCTGSEEGYSDSYSFVHRPGCLVLLVQQLQETMHEEVPPGYIELRTWDENGEVD